MITKGQEELRRAIGDALMVAMDAEEECADNIGSVEWFPNGLIFVMRDGSEIQMTLSDVTVAPELRGTEK